MNASYNGVRNDLIDIVEHKLDGSVVLDFGCYRGANANYLKNNYSGIYYVGVESDPQALAHMDASVDQVIELDLDDFDKGALIDVNRVDVVILSDILEHLKRPDEFMRELTKVINNDTLVLVSIPNVQYYETFLMLLFGRFPRRERGIFDKTHLRWFTKREFVDMVSSGYEVVAFKRKYRLIEKPSVINRFTLLLFPMIFFLSPFFTFQMYFVLKKLPNGSC